MAQQFNQFGRLMTRRAAMGFEVESPDLDGYTHVGGRTIIPHRPQMESDDSMLRRKIVVQTDGMDGTPLRSVEVVPFIPMHDGQAVAPSRSRKTKMAKRRARDRELQADVAPVRSAPRKRRPQAKESFVDELRPIAETTKQASILDDQVASRSTRRELDDREMLLEGVDPAEIDLGVRDHHARMGPIASGQEFEQSVISQFMASIGMGFLGRKPKKPRVEVVFHFPQCRMRMRYHACIQFDGGFVLCYDNRYKGDRSEPTSDGSPIRFEIPSEKVRADVIMLPALQWTLGTLEQTVLIEANEKPQVKGHGDLIGG